MATAAIEPEVLHLEPEKKEALELVQNATGLKVVDTQTFTDGAAMLKAVVEKLRGWREAIAPAKEAAHQAHKRICDLEKTVAEPLMHVESYLRKQLTSYTSEQERIRREEEAELRREAEEKARKEAEEAQIAAALEAEQSGDKQGAEQILAAAPEPVFVPPVVLERAVPKVAGLSTRKNWKFRIVDAAAVPREFLVVDEVRLGKYARAMGEQAKVQGVEFYPEDSAVVR
jgi:hypothetical protein